MTIGMMEFPQKVAELPALGVNKTSDIILARLNRAGALRMQRFGLRNKGNGKVTFTLKKRGVEATVTNEDIESLQVGSSDRFRGVMANRRVTPGTVVIEDANATPQRVEDTNSDGILWQTNGPVGPTYPRQVGTINYNDAIIDFTFELTVTLTTVNADYKHKDWSAFSTPITFDLEAGGVYREYIVYPDNATNFVGGLSFDEEEIGFAAKLYDANQVETILGLEVCYHGDDSLITLPIIKGEIEDYPYHNA